MTEINLLPWREQKRAHEKREFNTILSMGIIGTVFILCGLNYYATQRVSNQLYRNQIIQAEINTLDEWIKELKTLKKHRHDLISKITIVQRLQSMRIVTVHLFDELIKVMPAGVYIDQLEQGNGVILLKGYSKSNALISLLMKNIEENNWLESPVLIEIKNMEKNQTAANQFKLSIAFKPQYRAEQ